MKCQAMENTYSKNSYISPQKFPIYRSCIKFGLKIIFIYLTSIINFNYSIPFCICHNTTKRKEMFSLKGTTFGELLVWHLIDFIGNVIMCFTSHWPILSSIRVCSLVLTISLWDINEKNVQITDKRIYVSHSTHCKYKQSIR